MSCKALISVNPEISKKLGEPIAADKDQNVEEIVAPPHPPDFDNKEGVDPDLEEGENIFHLA